MKRGFITIATGSKHYYKIAANLLLSYRYFTKDPLPFAIIAEEENEYTALFDDVILTNESYHSFLDKFLLLKLAPYDENIYIDADSLAFDDLNKWWDLFENATDFSAIGVDCDVQDQDLAWYNVEEIGSYGANLKWKSRVHAGVCFIRNKPTLKKMYQDCIDMLRDFDQLHFRKAPNSVDECILGVAMPMNGMKTTPEEIDYLAVYPFLKKIKASIWDGNLSCTTNWNASTKRGTLVHFGTYYTHQEFYRFNEEVLHLLIKYKGDKKAIPFWKKILYKYKWRYFFLKIECGFKRQWKTFKYRVKKLFGKK